MIARSSAAAMMDVMPGGGGTQYMVSVVGRARALELILGGQLMGPSLPRSMGVENAAPTSLFTEEEATVAHTQLADGAQTREAEREGRVAH
ncbi:hypothetical protein [Nesterenkonia haasae]|uniref:hypothetical protein n=1 Tax=Nesterenkonia haasae TaxID=2587813 RepID=UPI00192EA9F0|nr:hypothetical protein [Nesterenkonia haasae]